MRESVRSGTAAQDGEAPPDPFEDLAAPPLRLTPRSEQPRVVPFPRAQAPVEAAPAASGPAPLRPAAPIADADQPDIQAGSQPGLQAIRALPPAHRRSGGSRREIGLALVVGFVIAAAIVAGAVYLRPAPGDAPAMTALGSGPTPDAQASQVAATPVSDVTVRLRLPAGVDAARPQALRDALAAAGFARVEVSTLTQPIGAARVDYAHPEDRAAAETLAQALAPLAGGALAAEALPGSTDAGPVGHVNLWIGP